MSWGEALDETTLSKVDEAFGVPTLVTFGVTGEMPNEVWLYNQFNRVWPFIKPAVDRTGGAYDKKSVWALIEQEKAQLWPGVKSGAITEISETPTGRKSLTIWLAGGDLEELMNTIEPALCDWAKSMGCTHVEIIGRRGWVRSLKEYDEVATVVAKELQ